MMRREGQRVLIEGAVTATTHVALRAAAAALLDDATVVDWDRVDSVDSSALSLLLAWRRRYGGRLEFQHLPVGLTALAELYGIKDLLDT